MATVRSEFDKLATVWYRKVLPSNMLIRAMATSVKLDDDLKKRIRNLADKRHRSPHWIMREAIRD